MSNMALDGVTPRARATDPVTSVDAGRAVDLTESQAAVLEIFNRSGLPFADHQLVSVARVKRAPFSDQRIRSARAELVELGRLVLVEGEYRMTSSGRRAQVWALAEGEK